jgi:ATP-binding cassette subfamily C protein
LTVLAPDGRTVALQGANFSASPGEIIGIIGPSGAGKSTLARALANAATPRMGAVRIDGARYSDWDEEALARHLGYLPQRIELFDGPVSENIARFSPPVDERGEQIGPKIVEAAQRAGAHELILRLPKGYETELGPSGAGISPGQAQRIALARALYGDPRVLVLDEPNSHLDQDGESALIAALDGVRKRGGVAFVVAHRAGVLAIVDKIMLVKDGRIADFGTRATMMAKLQPQRTDAGAAPVEGVRP